MTTKRYFQNFSSVEDIVKEFDIACSEIKDEEVLFAHYGNGSYSGGCTVLFQRNGKLYEVDAGHCSCYGLEGQWSPDEVTWDQLAMRGDYANYGDDYGDDYGDEAKTAWFTLIRTHVPRA